MAANLLLVTPASGFGDSIRRMLEETDAYHVSVVNNVASAVVRANEERSSMALLDLSFGEEQVLEIGLALRTVLDQIDLAIICDDETPPSLEAIRPWALLRKPFHTSDIFRSMSQTSMNQLTPVPDDPPAWLNDVSRAAQHLTRLMLASSAQAALITRENNLWAYAGGLSQSAAEEVAQTVTRNWDGQKGSDLLRFVRLESTGAEHMVYATRLAADLVMALVFDAETPFSTIRSQANQLISRIGGRTETQSSLRTPPKPVPQIGYEKVAENTASEIQPTAEILADMPIPNPKPVSRAPLSGTEAAWPAGAFPPSMDETHLSANLAESSVFSRETSPAVPPNKSRVSDPLSGPDQSVTSQAASEEPDVSAPSKPRSRRETPVATPPPGQTDVTRPGPTTEAHQKITLEPISAGLYHLTYACLLVPRFSSHYLTGDLADRLSDWLPVICVAFGWRLEFLALRPEYLQWVVNVQPNTSPGNLMRIMRQQTSEKIFAEFARLRKENPSGDFWAPGYLIMGGTQPHPPQLVRDYIQQTRRRQGQESASNHR